MVNVQLGDVQATKLGVKPIVKNFRSEVFPGLFSNYNWLTQETLLAKRLRDKAEYCAMHNRLPSLHFEPAFERENMVVYNLESLAKHTKRHLIT
jgi:hypothetical protein